MPKGLYGILVVPLFQVHDSKDLMRMSAMNSAIRGIVYLDIVGFRILIGRSD